MDFNKCLCGECVAYKTGLGETPSGVSYKKKDHIEKILNVRLTGVLHNCSQMVVLLNKHCHINCIK